MKKLFLVLLMIILLMMILGCTLGPQVKTKYVIVKPGLPVRVLENRVVRVKMLNGSADSVNQDIGGWIAMPPEHWDYIVKKIGEE